MSPLARVAESWHVAARHDIVEAVMHGSTTGAASERASAPLLPTLAVSDVLEQLASQKRPAAATERRPATDRPSSRNATRRNDALDPIESACPVRGCERANDRHLQSARRCCRAPGELEVDEAAFGVRRVDELVLVGRAARRKF